VLLCEDSAAARTLTAALLERLGCAVDAACDGEEAVERARPGRYDVILMDLDMPVLDGEAAARRIRALGGAAGAVPIVALSGFVIDLARSPALSAVFDAALAKPLRRADLKNALAGVLPASAPLPEPPAAPSGVDGICALDIERLNLVLNGLPGVRRPALLVLAADEISRLTDELATAARERDCQRLCRLAHQICGTAANFAATTLSRLAAAMEKGCRDGVPSDIDRQAAALTACARATVDALRAQCQTKGPK
jgi:CheY-like chemotaxis protein/HPt (histidine-containing phosphotransfer) domain-containing protein